MLHALINFLLNRKGHPQQQDSVAPYKVEAPEPVKCGCGRSSTGLCVGLHKLTDAEWAVHPDNKTPQGTWPFPTAVAPEEKKPAAKPARKPRAKKAPVAAITAAEKPARKPRTKKAKE